jgi:hypothetical protein
LPREGSTSSLMLFASSSGFAFTDDQQFVNSRVSEACNYAAHLLFSFHSLLLLNDGQITLSNITQSNLMKWPEFIYSKVCSSSLLNCTHITRLCLDESTAFRPVTSSRSRTPYANTSVFSFMIPCMKYSGAIYLKIGRKVQVKTTTKMLYLTMKAWSRLKRQPVSPECAFNGIHNMMGQFVREPLCKPKIWYLYKEGAKL